METVVTQNRREDRLEPRKHMRDLLAKQGANEVDVLTASEQLQRVLRRKSEALSRHAVGRWRVEKAPRLCYANDFNDQW